MTADSGRFLDGQDVAKAAGVVSTRPSGREILCPSLARREASLSSHPSSTPWPDPHAAPAGSLMPSAALPGGAQLRVNPPPPPADLAAGRPYQVAELPGPDIHVATRLPAPPAVPQYPARPFVCGRLPRDSAAGSSRSFQPGS